MASNVFEDVARLVEALNPLLVERLGPTIGLRIELEYLRRDYEVWCRCTRCKVKFQHGTDQNPKPLLTLSYVIVDDALPPRPDPGAIPVIVEAGLGLDEARKRMESFEQRYKRDEADRKRSQFYIAERIADSIIACSCIHHAIRSKAR